MASGQSFSLALLRSAWEQKNLPRCLTQHLPLSLSRSASFRRSIFRFLCCNTFLFCRPQIATRCVLSEDACEQTGLLQSLTRLPRAEMEPASVLAFVLVGLKSAKAAYEILSSFKDGPENVKRATADVEGLLLTLVQLSKCRALEKESSEALRATIDVCLGDMNSFVRELTKLTLEPQSSRHKQYWKRLMAMWEEKALSKMSARVASHTSSLSLWLNVLQRYIWML